MRRACTARPSRMSIVAASTFAPVATRGVTLGRWSNDRASATRLARPAVTARAQAKADVAVGDVAVICAAAAHDEPVAITDNEGRLRRVLRQEDLLEPIRSQLREESASRFGGSTR